MWGHSGRDPFGTPSMDVDAPCGDGCWPSPPSDGSPSSWERATPGAPADARFAELERLGLVTPARIPDDLMLRGPLYEPGGSTSGSSCSEPVCWDLRGLNCGVPGNTGVPRTTLAPAVSPGCSAGKASVSAVPGEQRPMSNPCLTPAELVVPLEHCQVEPGPAAHDRALCREARGPSPPGSRRPAAISVPDRRECRRRMLSGGEALSRPAPALSGSCAAQAAARPRVGLLSPLQTRRGAHCARRAAGAPERGARTPEVRGRSGGTGAWRRAPRRQLDFGPEPAPQEPLQPAPRGAAPRRLRASERACLAPGRTLRPAL